MKILDKYIDGTTMYRILLYTLNFLFVISVILSFFGLLYYKPYDLIISYFTLILVAMATHSLFSKIFKAPANVESTFITAIIIFFIVEPIASENNLLWLAIIAFVSIASKYIFSYKNKHIFNPAALAVLVAGLFQFGGAVWWIASPYLFVPTLLCGLVIIRKIRRYDLFFVYLVTSILTVTIFKMLDGNNVYDALYQHLISWPTIFFATFMLTEPLSTPPTGHKRVIYASIAGVLSSFPFHFGIINSSPELALIIANVYSYCVSIKSRLTLRLKEKVMIASDTYEFLFTKNHAFDFIPGQYMEWTLPRDKHDSRGVRRYFTISSAPHEKEVSIGVRFGENISSFKQDLLDMKVGDRFYSTSLGGDFTLQERNNLVFIAGGIGITPFISMIRDALHHMHPLEATLFYANKTDDIPYKSLLQEAEQKLNLKVVYLKEFLTSEILTEHCCDMSDKKYYLSGPHGMVEAYKTLLRENNIPEKNIRTDYFPGFA